MVIVVVALAVALGWVVDDRVTHRRTDDALARSITIPAVTAAPAELAAAGALVAPAPSTAAAAPMPSAPGVDAALADVLAASGLGGRVVGTVVDVATGTVLLDRSGAQLAAPASTAKLATAAALLLSREPTDRITTRAVAGSLPGQVVLVGGGDPTLSGAAADQATTYAGAARLSDLAAAIQASGFGPVTSIVVDATAFTGSTLGPGWDPADVPTSYAAPIEGLMMDGGRGAPAAVQRSGTPALAAGQAFAALLGSPGISVAQGVAVAGAQALGAVQSAPMLDLLEQMLEQSDNVLAEALARQVALAAGAPPSFEGAAAATISVLAALKLPGLDAAGLGLADASGLSTLERVAPAALAAILRAASDGAQPRLSPLIGGLPVAGWDGTLFDR
ncbi:MAG: dacB, partial [Jatrophihabitantaceae bacterium]|nr:dacB [Jatrophihabitantaceae bacterium]